MTQVRRVLFISGTRGGGTLRYRVRLAQEALATHSIASRAVYFTDPAALTYLPDADVLALYRVPATPWLHELVRRATLNRTPVTYDIDDLVFTPDHLTDLEFLSSISPSERAGFVDMVPRRQTALQWADAASATTSSIAAELAHLAHGPVRVVPNGVGRVALAAADQTERSTTEIGRPTVTLGYFSGSNTHDADWKCIEGSVRTVLTNYPNARLLLVGELAPTKLESDLERQVERIPFCNWTELFPLLARTDINLVPLTGTTFTNGKSAIKWLEAALTMTPTIATATEPHAAAITDRRDGVLLPIGADWTDSLAELIEDRELRADIGYHARSKALADFGPEVQADRYREFFESVSSRSGPPIPRAEYRVPRSGTPLEPYPFVYPPQEWPPSSQAGRELRKKQIADLPRRAWSKLRRQLS